MAAILHDASLVAGRVVTLGTLQCACGSDDVICIEPGTDAERHGDLFLITRGRRTVAWCGPCTIRRGWLCDANTCPSETN